MGERGVGLVEIMLALTILSLTMMSLGALMFQVARGTRQAAQVAYRSAAIQTAGGWAQTLPWDSIPTRIGWSGKDTIGQLVYQRYMSYADSTKYRILTVIIRPDTAAASSSRIRAETVTVVRAKPLKAAPLKVQ